MHLPQAVGSGSDTDGGASSDSSSGSGGGRGGRLRLMRVVPIEENPEMEDGRWCKKYLDNDSHDLYRAYQRTCRSLLLLGAKRDIGAFKEPHDSNSLFIMWRLVSMRASSSHAASTVLFTEGCVHTLGRTRA